MQPKKAGPRPAPVEDTWKNSWSCISGGGDVHKLMWPNKTGLAPVEDPWTNSWSLLVISGFTVEASNSMTIGFATETLGLISVSFSFATLLMWLTWKGQQHCEWEIDCEVVAVPVMRWESMDFSLYCMVSLKDCKTHRRIVFHWWNHLFPFKEFDKVWQCRPENRTWDPKRSCVAIRLLHKRSQCRI